jgi:hypothetical protein
VDRYDSGRSPGHGAKLELIDNLLPSPANRAKGYGYVIVTAAVLIPSRTSNRDIAGVFEVVVFECRQRRSALHGCLVRIQLGGYKLIIVVRADKIG